MVRVHSKSLNATIPNPEPGNLQLLLVVGSFSNVGPFFMVLFYKGAVPFWGT